MKLISTVIKPFALDPVREALTEVGIEGMTVFEVSDIAHTPKISIDVVVADDRAERTIEIVRSAPGMVADDRIFVRQVAQAVRIRTGETGANAL